jgi:hypothetical protein
MLSLKYIHLHLLILTSLKCSLIAKHAHVSTSVLHKLNANRKFEVIHSRGPFLIHLYSQF